MVNKPSKRSNIHLHARVRLKLQRQSLGTPTTSDRKITEIGESILELCRRIPQGKVTTYGAMAGVLDSSARAVGQSMRNNPYAPAVPCHRVVASDGSLYGFGGSTDPKGSKLCRKAEMLAKEGVEVQGGKVLSSYILTKDDLKELI